MTNILSNTIEREGNVINFIDSGFLNSTDSTQNNEILRFIINNGMIDLNDVQNSMNAMKRDKLLSQHQYEIWQGKDDKWRTYLPDENYKNGRRLLKRANKKDIEDVIIQFVKTQEEKKDITFKRRFEIWVNRQKDCGVSDNTISKYKSDYKRFFEGIAFEKMDIDQINDDIIIAAMIKRIQKKELYFRAVKSMFGMLNGVFEKSFKDKLITENPCQYIDLLPMKKHCKSDKQKTAEERTVSDKQMQMFYDVFAKDHKEKPNYIPTYAVELATLTGMRAGELAGLTWSHIDFNKKHIIVCQSEKYNRLKKEHYIARTKNEKERVIPISDEIEFLLRKIKRVETEYGYLCEFVFANENGRIHARTISDCARNKSIQIGIEVKSIHSMRRTLNSKMRCEGVSATVASAILGHTEKVNNSNYTYDVSDFDYKSSVIAGINKRTVGSKAI